MERLLLSFGWKQSRNFCGWLGGFGLRVTIQFRFVKEGQQLEPILGSSSKL